MTTTPNRKPLAEYKHATVTPLMQEYAEWLTANTGVKVDPLSVFLGSALRSRFQAERREAKAKAKPAPKPRATKRATTKATSKAAPTRRSSKGSTVATRAGVVIAEQRHVDAKAEQ